MGPEGPSGVVSTVFQAGSITAPATSLAFIAPTARVTVANGLIVSVISSASIGSPSGTNGGRALDLDICYRESHGAIARIGSSVSGLTAAASQQHLFTLAAVSDDLSAGIYDLGLCGSSSDAADWSLGGGGQTTAQVLKAD